MSQSRTTRTRSRRGSLEKESENSMDDNILPATVVEAVRKSSRGRILKESSKVAGRMRNKNDTEVEKDKTDSSDNDIKDGFQKQVNKENVNGSKSVSSDSSTGQPLVLDDLIDDFGDEELEDCESAGETGLSDDEIENEESELILELPADSDEEVSNEIAEEMKNYEPSTLNTSTSKLWKYGKLWEFVRDLLHIEKYNPSVIRWENVEEGEFRIVDSVMVSQLWATVRGNKRMNFEKLSRAMRYYYKYKIFEIAPNKRLVYKFGPCATGWKPRPNVSDKSVDSDPTFIGPIRRCTKCLALFRSTEEAKVHMATCNNELVLPEDVSKADADKLRSHILSRSIPDTHTSKPLRQKLSELKSKPLLENPPENIDSPPKTSSPHTDGSQEEVTIDNSEHELSKDSLISSIQTKTSSEQLALESLMSLGEERTSDTVEQPVTEPSFIPLTVTEIFKQPNTILENSSRCSNTEEESAVNLHIPEGNDCDSVARNYIVIPSFEAVKRPDTITTPKLMSNIKDKISFLKSAAEKSKTQTILQKRGDGINKNQNMDDESDDEIEIVKIIKTPSEERPNPFQNTASGSTRNLQIIPEISQKQPEKETPNNLILLNNKTVLDEKTANKVGLNGENQATASRKITINEKYLNMGKSQHSGVNKIISINPKYMNFQNGTNDGKQLIKINEKYQNFVPNQISQQAKEKEPQNTPDTSGIQVINAQHQTCDIETVKIIGQSEKNVSTLLSSNNQERTIRINSKYSNFIAGKTPEECGNIASNEEEASTSNKISTATDSIPRIKINEKYANYFAHSDNNIDVQTSPMIQVNPVSPNITSITKQIKESQQPVSNGPPNKTLTSALTLTSKLRNTKISDIRAQRAEESQNVPLDLSSLNHPSLKRKETINDEYMKRPKLDENIRRRSDTNCHQATLSPIPTNPFIRRHSDNYGESSLLQISDAYKPEPLPGLWKFLRSLLHNPGYNPKLVTWEILEDGMFRIHNLEDFYALWKSLKGTKINYELLSKTLKIYDERKLLHGVPKHRCVYKFGENAEDWRPYEGEISRAGKRPVPNQATWPHSRFYQESNIHQPTTLFTLTPLDKGATELSELKVLSDNSSIVKTKDSMANVGVPNPPEPEKEKPKIKPPLTATESVIKSELADDDDVKFKINPIKASSPLTSSDSKGMEIACKLTLPTIKTENAILKFDGGFCLELDRSFFKSFETTVKKDPSAVDSKPKIRTSIIHKDKSNPFKFKRKKIVKKKFAKKIKPPVPDGPLTASQLMDVVIPKKLNFLKAPISHSQEKGAKKLNFILPKPVPESMVSVQSVVEEKAKTAVTEEVTNTTVENPQFILQPMYTLSYQPVSVENNTTSQPSSTSVMSNVVSLHLSEPTTNPATSSVLKNSVLEEKSSAVRHKLPLIVTQRPSSFTSSHQISPRKDTNQQDQQVLVPVEGSSRQHSV